MDSVQGAAATTTILTPRISIFDIHFILAEICNHLPKRDICQCSLASHAFRTAFQPFLWRDVSIVGSSSLDNLRQFGFQEALTRYAPFVQTITAESVDAWPLIFTRCEALWTFPPMGDEDGSAIQRQPVSPQRRTFPNLRTVKSLTAGSNASDVSFACDMMMLVFPMLDAAVAPRLEYFAMDHLYLTQRGAGCFEFLDRIRQHKTLKRLDLIKSGARQVPIEMVQKTMECIQHIEVLKWNPFVYRKPHPDEDHLGRERLAEAVFQRRKEIYVTQDPPLCIERNRVFLDRGYIRLGSVDAIDIVSGTTTTMPEVFSIKDLDLSFMVLDAELSDPIVTFLERCPDMERFVVPSILLRGHVQGRASVLLLHLLIRWSRLKELIIPSCNVGERGLKDIIRAAAGKCRRRHGLGHGNPEAHPSTTGPPLSLDTMMDPPLPAPPPPPPTGHGRGLTCLHISGGVESLPLASQAIIKYHSRTLVNVRLVGSKVVNHADLQRLLCCCPNLEVLETMDVWGPDELSQGLARDPILRTADIVEVSVPDPGKGSGSGSGSAPCWMNYSMVEHDDCRYGWGWVCKRLRVLTLRYYSTDPRSGRMTGIPFDMAVQVGKLRHLEDLRIGRQGPQTVEPRRFSWTSTTGSPFGSHQRQQQQQQEQRVGEAKDERTLSVTVALQIWARELSRLRMLELRGLQDHVNGDDIRKASEAWKQIEWIQY